MASTSTSGSTSGGGSSGGTGTSGIMDFVKSPIGLAALGGVLATVTIGYMVF
jgi:hypothetical protein